MRLALFVFSTGMIIWLTHSRHSMRFEHEFRTVYLGLAPALTNALYLWVAYIACEPLVRRFWPQILISWTRLLAGRVRAPDVGRDFLLGALGGMCALILFNVNSLAHLWIIGQSDDVWGARILPLTLAGSKELLGEALAAHLWGLQTAAIMLTLLVLLRILLQSKRLALIIWFATHTIFLMLGTESTFAIGLLPISLIIATHLLLLVRFGFLALVTQMTTFTFAGSFPLTLEVNHWYFSHGMFAVAWISGIAIYGYYISLGDRSLFSPVAIESQ